MSEAGTVASASGPAALDPAVESLMLEYELTATQATHQMQQQVAAGRAELALPADLLAVYSGREIDHSRGGRVRIAATDPDRIEGLVQHFASHGVPVADVLPAELSTTELDTLATDLQRQLNAQPVERHSIAVGRAELGRVTIEVASGESLSETEQAIVQPSAATILNIRRY